jgi:type IV secretion system protein VirB5
MKHSMKVKVGAVALMLAFSAPSFAGIPVSVLLDIPATINQVQTLTQWAKQYTQMISQLKQMKSQYDAITGSRGLGAILNNPALRGYLPNEWAGIYDAVKGGKLSGITSKALKIIADEKFDPTATGARKRQNDVLAANKAMAMESYDATLKRVENINALMKEADATSDLKAAAELQNRMAAENAMIQNEQIRLNLLVQLQAAEKQLADQQRAREFDLAFAQ